MAVLKWLFVTLLALFVFSGLMPLLRRLGVGRIPGDFRTHVRGREVFIPLGSTIVLSAIAVLVGRLV